MRRSRRAPRDRSSGQRPARRAGRFRRSPLSRGARVWQGPRGFFPHVARPDRNSDGISQAVREQMKEMKIETRNSVLLISTTKPEAAGPVFAYRFSSFGFAFYGRNSERNHLDVAWAKSDRPLFASHPRERLRLHF